MQSLVIYFSKFGNTQIIAQAIAEQFASRGPVRLVKVTELVAEDFDGVGLVVVGCPTHRMRLPEEIRPIIQQLPRRKLKQVPTAAFDTSYKMSSWLAHFTAARRLGPKLRKLGGKLVVPPETFTVAAREGPLCDGEVERARAWAETIMDRATREEE